MTVVGCILCFSGALICLAGEWRLLVITYRYGLAWFFGSMFVPFVSVAFLCLHFKEGWRAFTVALAGLMLIATGSFMVEFH